MTQMTRSVTLTLPESFPTGFRGYRENPVNPVKEKNEVKGKGLKEILRLCLRMTQGVILILIGFSHIYYSTGCQTPKSLIGDIQIPNWQNGEHLYYGIVYNDTIIGRIQQIIYFDIDANIPVYILEIIADTEGDEGFTWDSSVVCFRRQDYAPIWSWRKVESDLGYTTVATRYRGSIAEIWRETIDGKESNHIKYKSPCFDNEMILTLLRGLRFNAAKKYSFNVLNSLTSGKFTSVVKYSGESMINTPAGTFKCDKVTLNYLNRKFYLYYEKQEPRRLVRYQERNSNTALVLLSR